MNLITQQVCRSLDTITKSDSNLKWFNVTCRHRHHSPQLLARLPGPGGDAGEEVPTRVRPRPLRSQSQEHRRRRAGLQEKVRLLRNPDHGKRKNGR